MCRRSGLDCERAGKNCEVANWNWWVTTGQESGFFVAFLSDSLAGNGDDDDNGRSN